VPNSAGTLEIGASFRKARAAKGSGAPEPFAARAPYIPVASSDPISYDYEHESWIKVPISLFSERDCRGQIH